ncbi:MAG: DsbA family protein [Sphingomonas sp.]
MRLLLVVLTLVGAVFSLSLATPAAARNWDETVTKLPDGAFLIGNPAAKVKLVEYLSYTCPHCAAFQKESAAVLRGRFIRSGSTSLEVRNQIHDQLDLDAALLARCAGTAGFTKLTSAVFAAQGDWLPQGIQFEQDNGRRLAMYPKMDRLKASAQGSGLTAIALQNGMNQAQVDACLSNEGAIQPIMAMMQAAPKAITGTPGFIVNGKFAADVYDWAHLQPILRAAGAR